jgi:hypothetical protein
LFYDQFTGQFTAKLAAGRHTFFVQAANGTEQVTFTVS